MDHAVLRAVAAELAEGLSGQPLADAAQLDAHRFLLRFEAPPFPRLHVAIHPRLSTIHLARGIKAPAPTELASELTRRLEGRRVAGVEKPRSERLLVIRFEDGQSLVAELMGKASNLLLLDGEGRIVRFARSHLGAFRRPEPGVPYEPPPAPSRWSAPDAESIGEEAFRDLLARDPEGGPARAAWLADSIPAMSALAAREVEHAAREGEDPWKAFAALRERLGRRPPEPVLYAPAGAGEGGGPEEADPLDPRRLFAFPVPLRHARDMNLVEQRFVTVNEAEAAATALMLRHLAYAGLRQSLSALLRQEARRGREAAGALQQDLARARDAAAMDRRRGELILAGLAKASRRGASVRVVDHYDPEGKEIEIPIDPKLDLKANAEKCFRSARRAGRALAIIPARLEAARERAGRAEVALARLEEARTRAALEALERELQAEGIVKALRREDREEVGRAAAYVPVREFVTRDGFTVVAGRSAADNDQLTFKVAAPHDLWLHAAGYPGAHVIVRNPRRLPELPETTVREAAALAAFLSQGKDEKELDVHVAWRRHVRKGRGMSPGMVVLKRHRTVRVAPALPRAH
ncbi:MAG TPA: NFACT family protein [Candidatus Polarisedimenticolia bacterium]|nr:NFACT family protein [Candidatus Polarisedimenticolia bacterium]